MGNTAATRVPPGPAKTRVMARRRRRGLPLFAAGDASARGDQLPANELVELLLVLEESLRRVLELDERAANGRPRVGWRELQSVLACERSSVFKWFRLRDNEGLDWDDVRQEACRRLAKLMLARFFTVAA